MGLILAAPVTSAVDRISADLARAAKEHRGHRGNEETAPPADQPPGDLATGRA